MHRSRFLLVAAVLVLFLSPAPSPVARAAASPDDPRFEREIKPLLERNCFSCHSSQEHSSGLALETLDSILKGGGVNGPAVIAGNSKDSPLVHYLRGIKKPRMPLAGSPLPEEQIALIADWIDKLELEPAQSKGKQEAQPLPWPWTTIQSPPVPQVANRQWVKNPIDAFVLSRLEAKEINQAPPVSKRVLLRRVYLDLIGLPPTPQEMEQFLADSSPDAYGKVVDRLLADPRYGERWARHWLDLVRYGESRGGGVDYAYPHMWRYRDYVIRAFNQDRPYDRFIKEQIAGDAFSFYGTEGKLGAGFLNLSVVLEGSGDELRQVILSDVVDTTGSVFLGITLGCARCHNHKYDPIPTRDYYRMEAFFAPMTVGPMSVPFSQYEDPERMAKEGKEWQALFKEREDKGKKARADFKKRLAQARTLTAPQDLKDMVVAMSDADLKLAMQNTLMFSKEERDLYTLIGRQEARFANPNHPGRYEAMAYSAEESLGTTGPVAPTTFVLKGGDRAQKGEAVEPGFLSAVTGNSDPVDLKGFVGSRRKLLADWIASPENPLTARVMVNRIWQHHFGEGLVATASDFGRNGSGTVYPELIDWLARHFIESGWSIKAMHRLILQSNTYRQAMYNPTCDKCEKVDAENRYLWRMNTLRLEAEAIRDSILAVSGDLNPQMGGPGFFPKVDDELLRRASTWWEPSPPEEANRRSIYMVQQRAFVHPLFKVFDGADLNQSCPVRKVTTVAPQVFALFNSQFVHENAQKMAERIRREVGGNPEAQVERAFQLALQRSPSSSEKMQCVSFLDASPRPQQTSEIAANVPAVGSRSDAPTGPKGSLADLCLVLLNANEFIFPE